MTDDPKTAAAPDDGLEHKPPERLSQREFAMKMRREAYLRVKEFRKTDPRQIAMQEKLKQQRRDAYRKAKERWKGVKAARPQAAEGKLPRTGLPNIPDEKK